MPSHFDAVDPDGRIVFHRLETEYDLASCPFVGNGDGAPIPDGIHEIGVLDARELRLRAKWDHNAVFELALVQAACKSTVATVGLELPLAVETQPIGTDKLRTGVLGTWNLCLH
jgi:hypothetical protein